MIDERERAALICDAEAFRKLSRNLYLVSCFGDAQDDQLQALSFGGDMDAFVKRAIQIDTKEAQSSRATLTTEGRLAWLIRSGKDVYYVPRPMEWRIK